MNTERPSESQVENREKKPFKADLRVDFIRHGKPDYTKEEKESAEYEGSLSSESREKVRAEAQEMAKTINKDGEFVVFLSTPKRRGIQTAEIYKEAFEKEGVSMYGGPLNTATELRDLKVTPEFTAQLDEATARGEIDGWKDWMEYWSKRTDLPEGTETPEEIKVRITRVLLYLEKLSRILSSLNGKKIHFFCFGHEETVRDLLEEAYGMGTKAGTGPIYGEALRMDIFKSEKDKDAVFDLKYGEDKATLGFNDKSGNFYKPE